MPRTFAGFILLLAVLALLSPGKAVAGPPEGASGKMAFDEVADGLRKYRKMYGLEKRIELLRRLATTGDPRVAVALGELLEDGFDIEREAACDLLDKHFRSAPGTPESTPERLIRSWHGKESKMDRIECWWDVNKGYLRRRAKQLPQ